MDDTFSAVDLNTDELIGKLQFNETVSSVKYNFDYSKSIASCLNNKIYLIDNSNFQVVKEITEIEDEINHLDSHKQGDIFLVSSKDGNLYLFQSNNGKHVQTFYGH